MVIHIEKPKLDFSNKYLIEFLIANMRFSYEGVIDNLNICNVLMLEKTIRSFYTKETKLKDQMIIKKESPYFTAQKRFGKSQRG